MQKCQECNTSASLRTNFWSCFATVPYQTINEEVDRAVENHKKPGKWLFRKLLFGNFSLLGTHSLTENVTQHQIGIFKVKGVSGQTDVSGHQLKTNALML